MRSHPRLVRLCAAAIGLAAAQVHAQAVSLEPEEPGSQHAPGVYTGVKPGGDEAPPIPGAQPGSTPPAITWPGFQMQPDGGSRVFVQMTSRVGVNSALTENRVVVDFGDVAIVGATNRLPLYTRFFNTPVTRVELRRANKRTQLILTLRTTIQPRVSTDQSKSGYWFVYVDFPPGNYLSGDAAPIEAPPEPESSKAPTPKGDPALRAAPAHLDGEASAGGQAKAGASASGAVDAELPPGMGKVKADGKAKGKAGVKVGL
jgi:hypothetical protein